MFIRARVGSAARRVGLVAFAAAALCAFPPAQVDARAENLAAQEPGRSAVPLALLTHAGGEAALLRADDPRALTAADFDSDGLPDLAAGFGAAGGGTIVVAAGNPDAIYPNTPEAKARREEGSAIAAPFHPAHVTQWIPLAPDFLLSGDFDADGDPDLLAFTRGVDQAAFLAGDGRGGFSPAAVLGLPGRVTAAITADVNRRDGLADVLLGLETEDGPVLLVAEGPGGAIRPLSEQFLLTAPLQAIAAGFFDDDPWVDIAVGSGAELWIVRGRDRQLAQDEATRAAVLPARVDWLATPAEITALAAGDWSGGFHDLAVLGGDGRARFLARGDLARLTTEGDPVDFAYESPEVAGGNASWIPARIGSGSSDTLVLLDRAAGALRRLHPLATPDIESAPSLLSAAAEESFGEPVAALALRLNSDALSDLVVLTRGGSEPVRFVPSSPSATFTVNSTNDANDGICDGTHCSLREAIHAANAAAGADTISFAALGAGAHTLSPFSNLPTITGTITLDGTTHPDGRIEIDGTSSSTGINLDAPSSIVRGMVINRAASSGVFVGGGAAGSLIEGSLFGLDYAGAVISANGTYSLFVTAPSVTVGGASPAARNTIAGSGYVALYINSASGTVVQGNYIGTDAAGTLDRFNGSHGVYAYNCVSPLIGGSGAGEGNLISAASEGLYLQYGSGAIAQGNLMGTNASGTAAIPNSTGLLAQYTTSALVGGTAAGTGNLISGNPSFGVRVDGSGGTLIQGNRIGTQPDGLTALPNYFGIYLQSGATVGGLAAGAGNIVARNTVDGVAVTGGGGSAIRGNSIFGNGELGIDLSDNGRSANDLTDSDAGPNLTQNFPVLVSASIDGFGDLQVTYSVSSDPGNQAYPLTVDFYEADLLGQGRVYLGSNSYSAIDYGLGNKTINLGNAAGLGVLSPEPLVAVATDNNANSSEFSDARLVGVPGATSFIVNTTNDANDGLCNPAHCSLREAIYYSNLNSGFVDTIGFNIPGTPPFTIAPLSPLPAITDAATVNAASQPGFAGTPIVELDGQGATGAPGLRVISAPNTTLRGFVVNRFTSGGIALTNSSSAVIAGNYIGTNVAGVAALANGAFGISIEPGSDNSLIGGAAAADRNLISGNASRDIYVQAVANIVIQGNRIGTNAAGTAAISNYYGVESAGSTGLVVGGAAPGEGNLISGNSLGVYLNGTTGSTVRGNLIGTDAAGTGSIANSSYGIYSFLATGTTVGGAGPGDGNVIAGSSYAIYLHSPTGGVVRGNFIGVAADAVTPLPNGLGISIYQGTGVSVGGIAPGEPNVIAFNSSYGVVIVSNGQEHALRRNSIFQNGTLGIDLEGNGVTANDPGDGDTGSNRLQNFPVIQNILINGLGDLEVTYLVDTNPANATYPLAIDLFKPDSAASFEGKTFVGGDFYSIIDFGNGAKTVNLGNALALGVAVGSRLVGMATDAAGNSSEFSPAAGVTGPAQIYVVNSANDVDDGACAVTHCSLREAIDASNTNVPAVDSVHFNIPGAGPFVIVPQSPLPQVSDAVTLDGTTQPGFAGSPIVQLSGSAAGGIGFQINTSGTTLRGFVVRDWNSVGILSSGAANTIAGNFVGTDLAGIAGQPNSFGIIASGASLVGGNTVSERNLISGNSSTGLTLQSGAVARGNWIGLNATGAAALGNAAGVVVADSTLGGAAAGAGNVVSGSIGNGVQVSGIGSIAQGNRIGTNASGSAVVANGGYGIWVVGDTGGLVGGSTAAEGNLVSGNAQDGIRVESSSTTVIERNTIGLDAGGTLDFGNGQAGVRYASGSSDQYLIDNVVSGNAVGVRLESGTTTVRLQGNRIGTNAAGSTAVGNSGNGVEVVDATLPEIGGSGLGNLISGNGGRGLRISGGASAGALVQGNLIGTDLAGGADLGNASDGIEVIDVANVVIGGSGGAGNLISGNNLRGLVLSGSSTSGAAVFANQIGTNLLGTAAIPNAGAGIEINAAPGNSIGGTGAGQGNLISGNGSIGVYVNGSNATGNVIAGNRIGTNAAGTAALGNGSSGVDISSAPANLVGGAAPGAGNLISGNGGIGLSISFSGATANLVQGNRIGTDLTASAAIPNAADGVQIFAAPGNTIGGSALGAGNVISGNTLSGVSLNFSGAAGNFVYGNLIGTQGDATTPLPNGLSGVTIAFNASSNRIGGTNPGEGNVIAGNTDDGITVESGVNDRLSGNSYFGNGGLAIDLGPDGVQPPDVGDGDSGANLLQNYPYLAAVASDGATTTSIAGSLSSTANATFTVELYASAGCDASGHGEGTTYLGSTTILADASGAAAFLTTLPVGVPNGATVTAVAITAGGSSSEFGPCILEDDLAIFLDSFEMGDTSAWAIPLQP